MTEKLFTGTLNNNQNKTKTKIQEVEGMYFPCSENKGVDQLRGYREADLRLCFRICKKPVFSRRGSFVNVYVLVISNLCFEDMNFGPVCTSSLLLNSIWLFRVSVHC